MSNKTTGYLVECFDKNDICIDYQFFKKHDYATCRKEEWESCGWYVDIVELYSR